MSIYSVDELFIFFLIYSVIGYLWEVSCVFILQGKLVNRGFLYGPCIPLYGFGAILILYVVSSISNPILIFIYGMVSASALELLTGFLMSKLFNIRYWDYSTELLNIKGYVCLKASLVWGLFSLLLVNGLHPALHNLLININIYNNQIIIYILIFIFAIDVSLSIKNAFDFKLLLEKIKEDNNNNGIPDIIEHIPEHMLERMLDAKNRLDVLKKKHPTAVFDTKLQEIIRKIRNL